MAVESIAKTLGAGSGIDTAALVQSLVEAQFAAKNAKLAARTESLTAQISAASAHKSNITAFASALSGLSRGGTLATQPTSSNSAILNVTRLSGANLVSLNARVEVRQLAAAQTAYSATVASPATVIGRGTLTLTFGSATVIDGAMTGFTAGSEAPVQIAIGQNNASLEGVAAAINAANAGVTASILTDADGSRLVVKGASGSTRAFTLTAAETEGHEGLAALNIGVGGNGTTIGSAAADAIVAVDGVQVRRDSNSISDLIPGVRIDIVSAQPGTVVSIGKTPPTSALLQAVQDIVDTYNELYAALGKDLDPIGGALRNDLAAKTLRRQLQQLTLTPITSDTAGPTTLAQIGVSTNRDGTLSLNTAELSKALVNYPDAVEHMLAAPNGTATTRNGLSAALDAIATAASSSVRGLGASVLSYTAAKTKLSDEQARAVEAADALRTRMTQQYASMDAKVAAYKSTMTFLENQIKAWNRND